MIHRALKLFFLVILCGNIHCAFAQRDSTEIFESGKAVFRTYCSPCHGVHQEKIGPMLASITKKRSESWLISFISNSEKVILSGDPYAKFLYEQYHQTAMPAFKQLSETKLKDVLLYIAKESANPSEEISPTLAASQPNSDSNVINGNTLFNAQCASCHFIDRDGVAPALGSVANRRPLPWLISFIKNSQHVMEEGDTYAVNIFNNYNHKVMPPFEFLNREEIVTILDYIQFASASSPPAAGISEKNIKHVTSKMPNRTRHKNINEEEEIHGTSFKIAFAVVALIGALIHGYILVTIFRYLSKH